MVNIIDKIYIIWHKEDLLGNLIRKIEEVFPDIPYEAIRGPDGNSKDFPKWLKQSNYNVVPNWNIDGAINPSTQTEYSKEKYNEMVTSFNPSGRVHRDHKYGELACGVAHHKAWKKAQKDGVKNALFLEQDAEIELEHSLQFKNYMDLLEYHEIDFDMLYLGFCIASLNIHEKVLDWLVKPAFVYCLHSYIVTDKGISKILQDFNDNLCVADEYIPALFKYRNEDRVHPSLKRLNNNLEVYCIYPRWIKQIRKNVSGSGTEFSEYYTKL